MTRIFHPGNTVVLTKDFFPYGHKGDLFTIVAYGRDLTMVRCNEVYTITIKEFNEYFEVKARVKQAWELEFEIKLLDNGKHISITTSRRLNNGESTGIDGLTYETKDYWNFYSYVYSAFYTLLNFIASNDGDCDITIKYARNKTLKVNVQDKRVFDGVEPFWDWVDTFQPEGIE